MELNYLILALALLVSAAGIQDVLSRRISNIFPLVIVLLFLIATTLGGWSVEVWQNFASFIMVLGIGAILFQRGILGGGAGKIWAAVAPWFTIERKRDVKGKRVSVRVDHGGSSNINKK